MRSLLNKTVLITGAGRGIGASAARTFAAAGTNVVLMSRSPTQIDGMAREITAEGGKAISIAGDVSCFSNMVGAVQAALDSFGGLDILINNAGIIDPIAHLVDVNPDEWGRLIDINVKGVFHAMRAALTHMKSGGTIITVTSGAAHNALEGWSAYCTSKAAAAMLTMAVHKEHAAAGIRALSLSPGLVATEMQVKIRASGVNPVSQSDPATHRSPEIIAKVLLWMCTQDADDYLGKEVSLHDESTRRKIGFPVD